MKKRAAVSMAVVLVLSTLLTACGGLQSQGNVEDQGAQGPQVIQLMTNNEPGDLDSATSTDVISGTILNNVMEGLMRLDKDDKPQPAIASSYDVSGDKKTYTFTLRDAKWSDGEPVKAQDFEYAWKRALNPKTKSEYAYILYPIKNAEKYNTGKAKASDVGVRALDDKTLEVKLEEPIPYFLSLTTFSTYLPQRKDIVEKFGGDYAKEPDKMVYNGPFVLTSWAHEQSLQLKKNDNYWDRNSVFLSDVKIDIIKDTSTGLNLYTSNQKDMTMLDKAFAEAFKSSPEFTTASGSLVQYVQFNTKNAFLSNTKIRKAISLAIDRESIVKLVLKDGSQPAGGFVPPSILGYNESFRKQARDYQQFQPAEAKQLFKLGMKELGIDSPPTLTLLSYNDERKDVTVVLKDQLEKTLGLKVKVNPQPLKQKIDLEQKGEFDLSFSGWKADYNDPMTFLDMWVTDGPFNMGKWSSKKFDELIKKSKSNPDFKERINDLIEAERILLEEGVAIAPVYYKNQAYLVKPHVKNLVFHSIGPEYTLKETYIDNKK
ncbi:oligopeptide transport system substrate-binding protein [Planifilum fimeticola]|uniref:Oligopeptide transport system substrate-binding protein n=1 Tax=Planifilum fimeticola TaxID=201975 RepID=A0A2T0LDX3_9BACL|nr:peptide ABC transporter substrate-binding protein [Planifilum fimeticola]PRX40242.1 oligopeptide transport system substrate-binding protein [Planifilum fimeticola]